MYTGNTGTAGASAPVSTITKTGPRYGLAAAWQRVAAEAQREYPHVNFDVLGPPAAFCAYRIGLENATQADVAHEANVSAAAVSLTLDRCRKRLMSSEHGDFTLPDPSPWAGLYGAFLNWRRPRKVWRLTLADEDWGQRRHELADREFAADHEGWAHSVASEVKAARRDVRRGPQRYGYAEGAAIASVAALFDPIPEESANTGRGWHLTGDHGESGMYFEESDCPARDLLEHAESCGDGLARLADTVLTRARRMAAAGTAPEIVAARCGVPLDQVRIVTGKGLPCAS